MIVAYDLHLYLIQTGSRKFNVSCNLNMREVKIISNLHFYYFKYKS